jgi:penicillin-binding protein-related factor A (putative recombinase)
MKRESSFSILFRHWIRANPQYSAAYEMKQTSTNSIPFSCLEPHQVSYLEAITGDKGVLVRVQGANGEPDYIYLRNTSAYVVIKYPDAFHVIPIFNFMLEKSRSARKSLTCERAEKISAVSVGTTSLKKK